MPRLFESNVFVTGSQVFPVGTHDIGPFLIGGAEHFTFQWARFSIATAGLIGLLPGVGTATSFEARVTAVSDSFLNNPSIPFRAPPNDSLTERQNFALPYFVSPAGIGFTSFPAAANTDEGSFFEAELNSYSYVMLRLEVNVELSGLYVAYLQAATGN